MGNNKEHHESTLFSVRIWRYDAKQSRLLWRGKVQDVSTGAWRYFHNWDDLVGFLNNQIEVEKVEEVH